MTYCGVVRQGQIPKCVWNEPGKVITPIFGSFFQFTKIISIFDVDQRYDRQRFRPRIDFVQKFRHNTKRRTGSSHSLKKSMIILQLILSST